MASQPNKQQTITQPTDQATNELTLNSHFTLRPVWIRHLTIKFPFSPFLLIFPPFFQWHLISCYQNEILSKQTRVQTQSNPHLLHYTNKLLLPLCLPSQQLLVRSTNKSCNSFLLEGEDHHHQQNDCTSKHPFERQ